MATFANITYEYTANTTEYSPLPINNAFDREGFWYTYVPVNASNDTTGAEVKLYQWGASVALENGASYLTIDGTIPLLVEEWDGANTEYHAGVIEHIGAGLNDITNAVEDNAIMFAHMGADNASDDAFYWDRFYLPEGDTEWYYYQYHKHLPSFYVGYEGGRETTSGGGFIDADDKSFGYQISIRVSSGGTSYQSRLARVHTPSIGGAHNSHNDVTLPSTGTKNYMSGGVIRGTSDRYHYFYISANSAQWDVFSKTYSDSSGSFTGEVGVGTFDLKDPVFTANGTSGIQQNFPVRASCGDLLGSRIYFPVLMTNQTHSANSDLEIWSVSSITTLDNSDLVRQVIKSNFLGPCDAQCITVGSTLYVAYSDIANGGVRLHSYDETTWTDEGQILTNTSGSPVRVHGFRYNSADTAFYLMLSGTADGGASTYEGDGIYSYKLDEAFAGYPHLDYDSTNRAYLLRNASTAGYLEYNTNNGSLTRYNATEPKGIATDRRILEYNAGSPKFYRSKEVNIGGQEFYEHVLPLNDGRKVAVGRVSGLNIANTENSNILISFIDDDSTTRETHFVYGGLGADFCTGVCQASDDKIWVTGYTKSELLTKRDIKCHGFLRNIEDGLSEISPVDVIQDSDENYYTLANHEDGYIVIYKLNKNFEEVWQYKYDSGSTGADVAYGIAIDSSDNLYICGSTVNFGAGSTDALLIKINPTGTTSSVTWSYAYGTSSAEVAKSVVVTNDGGTEYVVMAMETGTTTYFTVVDLDGTVTEVNTVSNLNVNRLRPDTDSTKGRFLFSGDNGANKIRYGMGETDSTSNRMIQWIGGFSASANGAANDIACIGDPDGSGNGADYAVVGNEESDGFVLQLQVDETLGSASYNVGKTWSRTLGSCTFNSVVAENYTNPNWVIGNTNRKIHVVGQAGANGVIVQYDNTGAIQWQNSIGFMGTENLVAVIDDATQDNIVSVGTKTSHSDSIDGMLFRSWKQEFGTGNYHINGNPTTKMLYQATTLTESLNSATITSISASADSTASWTRTAAGSPTYTATFATVEEYDGSFGAQGVFQFWAASVDLSDVQNYLNTDSYRSDKTSGLRYNFTDSIFNFYQVATVGDGTADDGNAFGYDIIQHSGGMIVPVGVTSGDIGRKNTGESGVYDYIIYHINPSTGAFMYFQNGSTKDEEIYAVTELENTDIAITGRSTGTLGDPTHTNLGGYDIFLGIHEMTTHTTEYYQTGSGFNDSGINIHDIGANTLVVTYSTNGALGNQTNSGSEDFGVVKFNYVTDVWGDAYQTGTLRSCLVTQNGHHSTKLPDGRIAIVGHSSGFFADDNQTSGLLDLIVGIIDMDADAWKQYQIGTGSNEFGTSIESLGNKLIIGGHTEASFEDGMHAVYLEFDASYGISGKSSSD